MQNVKYLSAWIPLLTGLSLLVQASRSGYPAVFLATIPAALMTAGGARLLLFPDLRAIRIGGHDCEQLCFASEFEPQQQLPGGDRWLS